MTRRPLAWCLAVLGALLAAGAARGELVRKDVLYRSPDGDPLLGYLVHDDTLLLGSSAPGLLLFHEWWGQTDFAREQADRFAELGYVVFVADMYGTTPDGTRITTDDPARASELAGAFYEDRTRMRRWANIAYIQCASNDLVDPGRISAVGYCFGGTCALELARGGVSLRGVVSFHGGLETDLPSDDRKIRGQLLVLNGREDPFVPLAEREAFKQRMEDAGVDYTFVDFGGAVHSFTNPAATGAIEGARYQERAAQRSFAMARDFLAHAYATPLRPVQVDPQRVILPGQPVPGG